jgi:hypothetical protein
MKTAGMVGLLVLLAPGTDQKVDPSFSKPVHLGCERDRVHLYVVNTEPYTLPVEMCERIAASSQGGTALVADLKQLRGLVRINDGQTALRFVRFHTSPATWYMWRDGQREVEIVAASRARGLPSFGLPNDAALSWTKEKSGWYGILSDKECRDAGFGPPRVEKEPGAFAVTRWIYSEAFPSGLITKVREVVEDDGRYERTVLFQMNAQRFDQLRLPFFE